MVTEQLKIVLFIYFKVYLYSFIVVTCIIIMKVVTL